MTPLKSPSRGLREKLQMPKHFFYGKQSTFKRGTNAAIEKWSIGTATIEFTMTERILNKYKRHKNITLKVMPSESQETQEGRTLILSTTQNNTLRIWAPPLILWSMWRQQWRSSVGPWSWRMRPAYDALEGNERKWKASTVILQIASWSNKNKLNKKRWESLQNRVHSSITDMLDIPSPSEFETTLKKKVWKHQGRSRRKIWV